MSYYDHASGSLLMEAEDLARAVATLFGDQCAIDHNLVTSECPARICCSECFARYLLSCASEADEA